MSIYQEYCHETTDEQGNLIRLTLERYRDAGREQVSSDLDKFLKGLADKGVLEIEGQISGSFSVRLPKKMNE